VLEEEYLVLILPAAWLCAEALSEPRPTLSPVSVSVAALNVHRWCYKRAV
jgi:hypothetical protein